MPQLTWGRVGGWGGDSNPIYVLMGYVMLDSLKTCRYNTALMTQNFDLNKDHNIVIESDL